MTWSTRCAAVSDIGRAPREGLKLRRLQLNASSLSWPQSPQRRRRKPWARMPQALLYVRAVRAQAGAGPGHITRMTSYLVDKREYRKRACEISAVFRELIGAHFIAMTAVQVLALIEDRAQVEIEVSAVVPAAG